MLDAQGDAPAARLYILMTDMQEAGITTYSKEAQRLYERGIAAARGGQRRIAAGLLTRAVQLDPRHEQAWLWLSGVLDDPKDIAFCLHSALKLNPTNVQAQRGLRWVQQKLAEQSQTTATPVAPPSRLQAIDVDAAPVAPEPPDQTWWQEWRESVRIRRTLRIAMLVGLVLLLGVTTVLYRAAEARTAALREQPAALVPTAQPDAVLAQQTILTAPEVNQSAILSYLSVIADLRTTIEAAATTYRERSTSTTLTTEQVDAARTYRDTLRQAYTQLERIEPPEVLSAIHAEYKQGIELEQSALDDVLQYYTNYNLAIANRAALRLQESGTHYERARKGWQVYQDQLAQHRLGISSTLR